MCSFVHANVALGSTVVLPAKGSTRLQSCVLHIEYKNYRHDERFDPSMYPMENGTRDYELPAGLTASEAAREIAFNAKMIA